MTSHWLSISKQQISLLPVVEFGGEIEVVDSLDKVADAIAYLEKHSVIGFDTETKPSFKKGAPNKMALMQLSTDEKCYLFRLNHIGIPKALADLISNPDIAKIGLSIHDDFHVMHRSCDVVPQGFVELQDFVKSYHISDISLQKVFAIIFDEKISKSQRLTNWEAPALTQRQQRYAATDAWACLKIFKHLTGEKFDPEASPYKTPLNETSVADEKN